MSTTLVYKNINAKKFNHMKLKQLGDLLKHEYPPRKGKLLGQRANFLHIREIGTNFQTVSVLSNQVRSYFSGGGNPR